ncbi:hypothetical protein AABB24_016525 [Solanum stoloniferum]|uniref:S-protein homolog n=1 Tax=Solanum stoloniferum TaxID=62892 RepID=A0ABD2TUG4_9SOLN
MDYSQFKTIVLLCIFFFFCCPQAKGSRKYTVCVYNSLPVDSPKLRIHCYSKDNDLGFHVLSSYENFSWSFKFTKWFLARTVFSCHFWWGEKAQEIDVFNEEDNCISDLQITSKTYCQWTTQEDGIYLSNEKGEGYKYISW